MLSSLFVRMNWFMVTNGLKMSQIEHSRNLYLALVMILGSRVALLYATWAHSVLYLWHPTEQGFSTLVLLTLFVLRTCPLLCRMFNSISNHQKPAAAVSPAHIQTHRQSHNWLEIIASHSCWSGTLVPTAPRVIGCQVQGPLIF